jgi:hypothetical protein
MMVMVMATLIVIPTTTIEVHHVILIIQILEKFRSGTPEPFRLINGIRRPMPYVRLLEVELYPTLLSKVRKYGLNDRWVQVIRSLIF